MNLIKNRRWGPTFSKFPVDLNQGTMVLSGLVFDRVAEADLTSSTSAYILYSAHEAFEVVLRPNSRRGMALRDTRRPDSAPFDRRVVLSCRRRPASSLGQSPFGCFVQWSPAFRAVFASKTRS